MRRTVVLIIVVGLAAGVILFPAPAAPESDLQVVADPPAVSVCAVEEGSGRSTTVGVLSTVNGKGRLTAFTGGTAAGSLSFTTGASGSFSANLNDVAAVGVAAALLELPSVTSGAGTVVRGIESVSAESCAANPSKSTLLAGGSTLSGQQFEVQLMNPYAGEAVVRVSGSSESGPESAPELESITIPSRASAILDLDEILPGRRQLTLSIETTRGSVISSGRLSTGSDSAVWSAVPAAQDWFLPIPTDGGLQHVVIATSSAADTAYQLDLYGPDGLTEAFEEGVVPGRGEVRLDVAELGSGIAAVRVIAAGPVAVFYRSDGATSLSVTSAAPAAAGRWLLPGAGSVPGGFSRLFILNPSTEDAEVVVSERRTRSTAIRLPVESDSVRVVELGEQPADGVSVEASVPVVVFWDMAVGTSSAASVGVPLIDE